MNRRQNIFACILACTALLFAGCMDESPGECPFTDDDTSVSFTFSYVLNQYDTDRFADEVNHITLLIYDESGSLQKTIEQTRTQMEDGCRTTTTLPDGRYTAVAWGNCNVDDFRISGQQRLETLQAELTRISNSTVETNRYGSLFHAMTTFTLSGTDIHLQMPMTKNNHRVRFVVQGLTAEYVQFKENFDLKIDAYNWKFGYDNYSPTMEFVTHHPEYALDGDDIIADFHLLRLFSTDRDITVALYIKHLTTRSVIMITRPLLPFIINRSQPAALDDQTQDYLDRYDEFEIRLTVGTDVNGNISIEDWDITGQPGEL